MPNYIRVYLIYPFAPKVVHPEKSENWTLHIRFAQVRDSGVYECQVNTEPKMSLAYHLNVVGEYG